MIFTGAFKRFVEMYQIEAVTPSYLMMFDLSGDEAQLYSKIVFLILVNEVRKLHIQRFNLAGQVGFNPSKLDRCLNGLCKKGLIKRTRTAYALEIELCWHPQIGFSQEEAGDLFCKMPKQATTPGYLKANSQTRELADSLQPVRIKKALQEAVIKVRAKSLQRRCSRVRSSRRSLSSRAVKPVETLHCNTATPAQPETNQSQIERFSKNEESQRSATERGQIGSNHTVIDRFVKSEETLPARLVDLISDLSRSENGSERFFRSEETPSPRWADRGSDQSKSQCGSESFTKSEETLPSGSAQVSEKIEQIPQICENTAGSSRASAPAPAHGSFKAEALNINFKNKFKAEALKPEPVNLDLDPAAAFLSPELTGSTNNTREDGLDSLSGENDHNEAISGSEGKRTNGITDFSSTAESMQETLNEPKSIYSFDFWLRHAQIEQREKKNVRSVCAVAYTLYLNGKQDWSIPRWIENHPNFRKEILSQTTINSIHRSALKEPEILKWLENNGHQLEGKAVIFDVRVNTTANASPEKKQRAGATTPIAEPSLSGAITTMDSGDYVMTAPVLEQMPTFLQGNQECRKCNGDGLYYPNNEAFRAGKLRVCDCAVPKKAELPIAIKQDVIPARRLSAVTQSPTEVRKKVEGKDERLIKSESTG